jgi:hypothetical protein
VVCNTRAVKAADGTYSTPGGRPLAGDVTYMTVGGRPNTAFLRGGGIPLDQRNHIQVLAVPEEPVLSMLAWTRRLKACGQHAVMMLLHCIICRVFAAAGHAGEQTSLPQQSDPLTKWCTVQVDHHLRVIGHQRVFAVGDATDVPETKLGYLAKAQVLPHTRSTGAEEQWLIVMRTQAPLHSCCPAPSSAGRR